ncbi:glycoside hydrolase family 88 protein [Breznakia pachnodae]|uniref:Unsaturated chondroitin disaccharide hydrolase n=1 Tax=Breznakia pachnodae TaxID=265178 RepID=A0ABU0E1E4_9FIRM|nr:glycoside hydrolase family 88 protein [Breznakia pachnodae]MDQ0360546.1 unsaturated chondroitin disaccharide hydrolase [Breznakia pachnodae]
MKYKLSKNDSIWLSDTYKKIETKIEAECHRIKNHIPYIAENGKYKKDMSDSDQDIVWWTNGFWPGILWQMYHATKNEFYKTTAEEIEDKLDRALEVYTGLHHDVGFMWLHTSVANYRMTKNERSKARALHAAHLLAGRYNPRGKFIRSWNRDRAGWVIVDSMMNLPLLYWARDEIGDPRFEYIAMDHADTVMNKTVRKDGSCNHIIALDPTNGNLLDTPAGQGYASGSSWSRGQAWAIYGFALSYKYTGKMEYLETSKKIANYFLSEIEQYDYLTVIDFRSPKSPQYWDSTAGVCAACGFLEISNHVEADERKFYIDLALKILKAIDEKFCNWDPTFDSIVQMGSGSYFTEDDRHVPIIYGDYFFIEAILRLMDKDILLW